MAKIKNNKAQSGQVCSIDDLGRMVVPAIIRKKYGIEKNSDVELVMLEDGVLIRKYQPGCIFCGNISNLTLYKDNIICKDCLKEMTELL